MNIELIVVGKTDSKEVESLVEMYSKRVNRYCRFSITTLADVRNTRNIVNAIFLFIFNKKPPPVLSIFHKAKDGF